MKYYGEGVNHRKAKDRLFNLITKATKPKFIAKEHEYPNPIYPEYPWRFDLFVELHNSRRIAIEIDGKVGHSSKKAKDKRAAKKAYLKLVDIELFGFPTPWIIGKGALPDLLFLEELHLK